MISIKAIFIIFYLLELGSLTTNNQVTIYKKMFTNVKKKEYLEDSDITICM